MAKGCKKCDPHDLCEECPEWIFTLADLIMCMMGLFVILWVLKPGMTTPPAASSAAGASEANNQFQEDMGRFRDGFAGSEPISDDPNENRSRPWRNRNGKGEGGDTHEKRESPPGTETLNQGIRQGRQAVVGGRTFFDPGMTRFTAETVRNLDEIAKIIKGHRNIILVKGHTSLDDLPEDASAEEKMALSLQRAKSVADYLTSKGVEPEILRVQGCSTFEPVKQRAYSPDALQLNRRVEVISTSTLVEDMQDRPSTKLKSSNDGESGEPAKPASSHNEPAADAKPAEHVTEHAAPAAHEH